MGFAVFNGQPRNGAITYYYTDDLLGMVGIDNQPMPWTPTNVWIQETGKNLRKATAQEIADFTANQNGHEHYKVSPAQLEKLKGSNV